MSAGQTVILHADPQKDFAKRLIDKAPRGAVLNIKEANRTPDQNAKMWAMLSDISRAKPGGRLATPDVWKALFMHALGHEVRFEHALDDRGVVPVGFRSSHLTKAQMADLITIIAEYGDRHGVRWTDQQEQAA